MTAFSHLPPGSVTLRGELGKATRLVARNRLELVDYGFLASVFRDHLDADGFWRGEFWGKTIRSAIRAWEADPSDHLRDVIDGGVAALLAAQGADGSLSSSPPESQPTGNWDVWGRKYALLGLVRYYESIRQAPEVKDALARALDHTISQLGPGAPWRIGEVGCHGGLAAGSILGAVVKVYRITGESRFLDFAKFIVEDGAAETFREGRSGKPPHQIVNGKAYEMTSCAEGLLELSRETGDAAMLADVARYYRTVRDGEIFITGGGGLKDAVGEYWDEGARKQTCTDGTAGGFGETCVAVTWIRFALNLLRETADASMADEIERTLYNALLGSMTSTGLSFAHNNPSPLAGWSSRAPAGTQIRGFGDFDCCLAQGPEGLATAARFAALRGADGALAVNLYEPAEILLGGGASLSISGRYPYGPGTSLTFHSPSPVRQALLLRIPGWSARTACRLNGEPFGAPAPASYLRVDREWRDGDRVELDFDYTPRIVHDPAGDGYVAFVKGPILFARDRDWNLHRYWKSEKDFDDPIPRDGVIQEEVGVPSAIARQMIRLSDGTLLVDYASAGSRFTGLCALRVWLR